ncbi:hypothetical protein ACFL6Q_01770 [Candidatus Neomarinimicrobiota bacterium]|jgi:hypothetical protein
MVTRFIYTEISPTLEEWLGRSWQKILGAGLGLILIGILVLTFPRLVALLVALAFFLAAGVSLLTAYHMWQLSKPGK